MKLVLATAIASLFVSAFPQATTGNDDGGWSSPVNGLQARLSVARGQPLNGTPLITTYLELRNVADVANVMELPFVCMVLNSWRLSLILLVRAIFHRGT
jgi:hypothetical protein